MDSFIRKMSKLPQEGIRNLQFWRNTWHLEILILVILWKLTCN